LLIGLEVSASGQTDLPRRIREAITAYVPTVTGDGDFALAAGFPRRDDDPRPISEIPEDELLAAFGE
jgi:hypothetical protein